MAVSSARRSAATVFLAAAGRAAWGSAGKTASADRNTRWISAIRSLICLAITRFKFGYEEVFVHFEDNSLATLNGSVTFTNLTNFLSGTTNGGNIITGQQFR